jgi:hypothetical protein
MRNYTDFHNNLEPFIPIMLYIQLKNQKTSHWSSVKEFSCLKAIDFALEAALKF